MAGQVSSDDNPSFRDSSGYSTGRVPRLSSSTNTLIDYVEMRLDFRRPHLHHLAEERQEAIISIHWLHAGIQGRTPLVSSKEPRRPVARSAKDHSPVISCWERLGEDVEVLVWGDGPYGFFAP